MRIGRFTNVSIIKAIFWSHVAVAAISLISVFLLLAGAFNLLWSSEDLSFWTRGMLFGLLFFAGMYGVNHVTNEDGFCVLTDLENFYRKKEGMPMVGRFMPRFYNLFRKRR